MDIALIIALIASTIRSTTPLLLAALGGLFSERSGVVNIALEGIMIFGALSAAVFTERVQVAIHLANPEAPVTWVPWLGALVGALVAGLVALVHAVISIRYRADQVISGTAINLLAVGVPPVFLQYLYNTTTDSPSVAANLPEWGLRDFSFSPLSYLAFLLVPLTAYVIYRTPFGLRLRAAGENPEAVSSVGVNVVRLRYLAVVLSGVLAGLAGAYLSVGNLSYFTRNLTAGQGFIALAALIFGKWKPWNTLWACLLFGVFSAVAIQFSSADLLPQPLVGALPFVLTMLVLVGFIGRSRAPKSLGKPYP